MPHQQSPVGRASCSIGVLSQVPHADDTTRSLFEKADKALYAAKHNGRDRAEIAN
ncbi:response regulator PleD [compost metagenome]